MVRLVIFCSADVEKLKKLILHNPFILTLPEVGDGKDEIIPKNVQQFWVRTIMLLRNYKDFAFFQSIFPYLDLFLLKVFYFHKNCPIIM